MPIPRSSTRSYRPYPDQLYQNQSIDDDDDDDAHHHQRLNNDSISDSQLRRHLLSRVPHHSPPTILGLMDELISGLNLINAIRGLIWGIAIASMHQIGMRAIEIPEGRIVWNPISILISFTIAMFVCGLGCITIDQIDLNLGRQLLFATLTSSGAFGFHYLSSLGATFLTAARDRSSSNLDQTNPNDSQPQLQNLTPSQTLKPTHTTHNNPDQIPLIITGLAIGTCLLSIGLLAHTAMTSRNRLAQLVFTKRRLWKVRAEKLAAEGSANLRQNFISVASHELRTPLFSVTGYADLLGRTDLNEEQKLYLTNMQQACANMQLIIANVLDFSKLERNNAESIAKPVCMNLRAMVEGIGRMTEERGRSECIRSVDLIVNVSKAVPETVLIDETFVLRICMNLLSNALKFTETGFILINLDMDDHETLVIKVQDTGIGIPRSFKNELFEPYRQADSSTTRPHQGTGLGLSICKQLVQRLDGKIEVNSIEGQGTTFIVTLPVSRPSDPPSCGSSQRICVSYQEPRTEASLSTLLTNDHHHVIESHQLSDPGSLPLDLDLILTDLSSLRQSSTLQALARGSDIKDDVAEHPPSCQVPKPIVVVTSSSASLRADQSECYDKFEAELGSCKNLIRLRRNGIIPHLIFNLLSKPDKYAHEIISGSQAWSHPEAIIERRESVGTIVTVNSHDGSDSMVKSDGSGSESGKMEAFEPIKKDLTHHSKAIEPIAGSVITNEKTREDDESKFEEKEIKKKKILLVDDNGMNVELGRRVLEKIGYDVQVAYDGHQAVRKACEGDCELVLMDCQMPGLDGPEATRKIREFESSSSTLSKRKRLTIIALTANVSESDRLNCMESGMDGFLPKPLQVTVLKSTLHRFLG